MVYYIYPFGGNVYKRNEMRRRSFDMKSKLYYLLVLSYICVVGMILYINGIFTGKIEDRVNLIINLIFLLVIGIMFCISVVSFLRVNNLAATLEIAAESIDKLYNEKRKCL